MPAAHVSQKAMDRLSALAHGPRLLPLLTVLERFDGAEAFLVGGAVRDALLARGEPTDLDVVVRGVALDALTDALSEYGAVNMVGKSFGVLKFRVPGMAGDLDIAWPRTERAGLSGGYRDFAVQSDPQLPIERDLERRDFTVNAMAYQLHSGELVDPFGGMADLEKRVLRAVGDVRLRFVEDHSRMLRAIRFACQLGFDVAPETWAAIKERVPHLDDVRENAAGEDERVVPYETVAKELVKAFGANPALAARLLLDSGALHLLMPELRPMQNCAQSPDHHSEGDVWTHTMLALAKLRDPAFTAFFGGHDVASAETALAVLLHDVAKPECAERKGDKITFYGHDHRGAEIAEAIGRRLRLASAGIDVPRLARLVKMHLFPNLVDLAHVKKTTLEKYFLTDRIEGRMLLHLAFADASAALRPDGSVDLETLQQLMAALHDLNVKRDPTGKTLLSGEEVMQELHLSPGPQVGQILAALKEAQLRGEVADVRRARLLIRGWAAEKDEKN